jgi:ribosome-associated toxin RatA of RatAB toxin-antitoxin module
MQKISRSALINFSAEQMYQLVNDIEKYHQFVPYCQSSKILCRSETEVTAELLVSKSGLAKSFTTKNRLNFPRSIEMELVDGPFSHLSGGWKFIALSKMASKIELDLSFEFSNKLTSLAFSGIFNKLMESMVSAFIARAEDIYAK